MISASDQELVKNAMLCQAFKTSEMYRLLDAMMAALEHEALDALSTTKTVDKDEIFALTVRWQERKEFRERLKGEIEQQIDDWRRLMEDNGLNPEEYQDRSEVIYGG